MDWLNIAEKYRGQHEVLGKASNQFILDCFKHTSYQAADDEVPWCAAFVGRCLGEAGIGGSGSAAAISYAEWGSPSELVPGAIVVFEWADGSHHVAFFHHKSLLGFGAFLGGNQSDMVKISRFSTARILAVRWPIDIPKSVA